MNTKILLLVGSALLLAPAGWLAAQQTSPTVVGHVLILDNERILEGDISSDGTDYILKRSVGELRIPASKALVVCGSKDEAFKIISKRANLSDADERVRLARWCQMHGMQDQAAAEARAALNLQPNHADAKHLLTVLLRPQAAPPSQGTEEATKVLAETALLDVSADCLSQFATTVQPILMNTCANCHASGRGGKFVLTRCTDGAGRQPTQINLSAAIKQICFDQPASSPLLFKACCAHGGAALPPLGQLQSTPFASLKAWTELVVSRNPHLRAHGIPATAEAAPVAAVQTTRPQSIDLGDKVVSQAAPVARLAPSFPGVEHAPATPGLANGGMTTPVTPQSPPTPIGQVTQQAGPSPAAPPVIDPNDVFSADAFNARYHPRQ
jgi:hypothetical protein